MSAATSLAIDAELVSFAEINAASALLDEFIFSAFGIFLLIHCLHCEKD